MASLELIFYCSALSLLVLIPQTKGHGRFIKPPSRSSIWRFAEYAKYDPPPNYTDNELFCGSVHQTENPGTECGVCGDPASQKRPRDNEIGGRYYKGIITGQYKAGETIEVAVELTRSHRGFMEWRLCPNPETETQDCFNRYLLKRADGQGSKLSVNGDSGMYSTKLKLPEVTCEHCIIQWNYRAGNNWGTCSNGTAALGCGPQETFRGCSDVSIA